MLYMIDSGAFVAGKSVYAADKIRIGYSGVTVSNAMLWVPCG
jgi:hypothetical protein